MEPRGELIVLLGRGGDFLEKVLANRHFPGTRQASEQQLVGPADPLGSTCRHVFLEPFDQLLGLFVHEAAVEYEELLEWHGG